MRKMFFNKSAHVMHSSYLWLTLPKHIFALLLIRKRINHKYSPLFLSYKYTQRVPNQVTDVRKTWQSVLRIFF